MFKKPSVFFKSSPLNSPWRKNSEFNDIHCFRLGLYSKAVDPLIGESTVISWCFASSWMQYISTKEPQSFVEQLLPSFSVAKIYRTISLAKILLTWMYWVFSYCNLRSIRAVSISFMIWLTLSWYRSVSINFWEQFDIWSNLNVL